MKKSFAAVVMFGFAILWAVNRPVDVPFEKHTIDLGANEACAFTDINGDGKLDIVSGENWFEAPSWTRHHFRDLPYTNNYIDDFSDLPLDVNGDGRVDIVSASWFGKDVAWFENPGSKGGEWKRHSIVSGHNVEFAFLVDLDNDRKAHEVLPQFGNDDAPLTWYEAKGGNFVGHVVSPKSYGHGIGVGDVNRDGRNDILTPKGWFEAPPEPRTGDWKFHPDFPANLPALGFMHVLDVNGDGLADIVTSAAHDYGVLWLEQKAGGQWTKHVIDDSWSQAHALSIADLNGDGRMDLITGKRYMAHNGRDPGEREPLGIYWYESIRTPTGALEWARHTIDYSTRTGAGMQVAVADYDADGDLDFAVGGKSGLFLFENLTKKKGK
jgi:hypothetical protein